MGYAWVWDLRSVNGKGLDLRLRVPDWIDGLEAAIRADLQKQVARGNVNLTLKVSQDEGRDDTAFRLNETGLAAALAAIGRIEAVAMEKGVTLRQPTSADVLTLRGVIDAPSRKPTLRRCVRPSWPTFRHCWPISPRCARKRALPWPRCLAARSTGSPT